MKKALVVASVASMIDQFNMPNIALLQEIGYEVTVACNFVEGNTCDAAKLSQLKDKLQEKSVLFFQIDFQRKITNALQNIRAYHQVKILLSEKSFDLIHCHSPIGGFITRIVGNKYRKEGTKVIYTAHGFHFYKGAPLKNWLLYYPAEKFCSYFTDVLITINKEDYALAKRKMKAKNIVYVPGVGIDLNKFSSDNFTNEMRSEKRHELNVADNEKMLLSVGELIPRKNHESVIRALAMIKDIPYKYFICGTGELYDKLQKLIIDLRLSNKVYLLGFRTDISKLCGCADLFIFPSFQEGLPVALMEAIASKTPVICSKIRGNIDLVAEGALFDPKKIESINDKIIEFLTNDKSPETYHNYNELKKFELDKVLTDVQNIYKNRAGNTFL